VLPRPRQAPAQGRALHSDLSADHGKPKEVSSLGKTLKGRLKIRN
jgi:hypothetical protein